VSGIANEGALDVVPDVVDAFLVAVDYQDLAAEPHKLARQMASKLTETDHTHLFHGSAPQPIMTRSSG
jgi:uncharacterized protein involved in cysteine biosynthesis